MAYRISKEFALSGDKTAVPDSSSSTELSLDLGWTSAYELSQETAGSRSIDRGQHNQLWNIVTANIKEWQDQGEPEYQPTVAYPKWMITRYTDGEAYICIQETVSGILPTNTNYFTPLNDFFNFGTAAYVNTGTGSSQVPTNADLGTAAYENITTSNTDFTDGRVLKAGDGGYFSENGRTGTYVSDWNTLDMSNLSNGELLWADGSTQNGPTTSFASAIVYKQSGERAWIEYHPNTSEKIYRRRYSGSTVVTDWSIDYASTDNATIADVNAGTSTTEVITPFALAGSEYYSFDDNATIADVNAGTSTTEVITPFALAGSDKNPSNRIYESSAQTIILAGAIFLSHGLGVEPVGVTAILECVTADQGYSVGDRIIANLNSTSVNDSRINSIAISDTNINVNFSSQISAFAAPNKSTGTYTTLNNSKWELYIKAWY